ncbi:5626_t:CDS:2, partial [Diversispora eburnea]
MSMYSIHCKNFIRIKRQIHKSNRTREQGSALLKKYPDRITSDIYTLLAQEPSIDKEAPTEIKRDQVPHLLFYGPPGTGKTTAIFSFCEKSNASDDRGINGDEYMQAQNALRRIVEKSTRNVRFFTAAYNYIDETVVYRYTRNPELEDIKYIVNTMLNDEFTTKYSNVQKLKRENSFALQDINR